MTMLILTHYENLMSQTILMDSVKSHMRTNNLVEGVYFKNFIASFEFLMIFRVNVKSLASRGKFEFKTHSFESSVD